MRLLGNWNWWLPFSGVQRHPPTLAEYVVAETPTAQDTVDTTRTDMSFGGKK
jgi:hypothetical protein